MLHYLHNGQEKKIYYCAARLQTTVSAVGIFTSRNDKLLVRVFTGVWLAACSDVKRLSLWCKATGQVAEQGGSQ